MERHERLTRRRATGLGALPLWLLVCLGALSAGGCASVEPWERERLALAPMEAQDMDCHLFEHNEEVYREGAVGANGGKSGGGCGCS